MSRIAKKSQTVKRAKPSKTSTKPPRYTIRKDSLDRRYAIEKRTGKRVSVSKADAERARRRKAALQEAKPTKVFHGIKAVPKPNAPSGVPRRPSQRKKPLSRGSSASRSEAAKKGWETRRAKAIPVPPPSSTPVVFEGRPPTYADLIGPLIPEGMKMHIVGGIADRAQQYPKVEKAADRAWINLQVEAFAQQRAISANQERPEIVTPRFDRIYGPGHGAHVRFNYYARATDLADIDQIVDTLDQEEDNDYVARELYTLYFSPEVA